MSFPFRFRSIPRGGNPALETYFRHEDLRNAEDCQWHPRPGSRERVALTTSTTTYPASPIKNAPVTPLVTHLDHGLPLRDEMTI
jgi:hypothetical protein